MATLMALQDMENALLSISQQPGVNFGGAPLWGSLTNPNYDQGTVDFFINRGYEKVLEDIADWGILLTTFTLASTATTAAYTIPPANYSPIQKVHRVYYTPTGLGYVFDYRPGWRLVSYNQYQDATGNGLLTNLSFSTYPNLAAISLDRTQLLFFPGSLASGDTITVIYAPQIGAQGNIGAPMLVNATDTPAIPSGCRMAILYYALYLTWMKGREESQAAQSLQLYQNELLRIHNDYKERSTGDDLYFRDAFSEASNMAFGVGGFY